ncbi:MAG TPA: NUDIX domain-containing protein [Gaiellaceae bacterium]|nr:NUDIX domain-containing protein [Gaiellaceae bacterium]
MAHAKDTAGNDATPSEVPDVLAPGLGVVFVGINPGRVSAAARAHFANPRNDFWRLLHAARLTSRLYEPHEQFALLEEGIGVTNAAYRTTPGSGDLRRADFAGSGERLGRIALELRPRWLAFVGKEAYRGAFGARPGLGLQQERLGDTELFVLPSTSPANAAVPWTERLRWFHELAGRASGLPIREGVRAVVVAPDRRTLLIHYVNEYETWWIPPGGGVDPGESDLEALQRELHEEIGLPDFEVGPLLFERAHHRRIEDDFGGQRNRYYLVRVPRFEVAELGEGSEARWFTVDELGVLPDPPRDIEELLSAASDW